MTTNDIVLSVKGVSKCFEMYDKPVHRLYQTLFAGSRKFYREFWALRDVSFDVRRGECIGIIGKNGAGKSTLLQVITGTLQPTTGTVETHGRIAALLELGSGFNPEFTGRENVYLNAAVLGLTKEQIDARYDEIVAFADIGEFIDQPVKTYSSGMTARLAFAVNAHVDADILIVDEALAVGDAFFQQKCLLHMKKILAQGVSLLFVSHSTSAVREICGKSLYLNRGRPVAFGDSAQVVEQYLEEQNQVRCDKVPAPAAAGPAVDETSVSSPSGVAERGTVDVARDFRDAAFFEKRNMGCRYGSRRAVINGVEILNAAGKPQDSFVTGEEIRMRMHVTTHAPIRACCFNLKISTANGVGVTHLSSLERACHFDLPADRNFIVDFQMKNVFGGGRQFMVQAGLTSVPTGVVGEHEILDCIECCNVFSSVNAADYPIWELADVPFKISLSE